MARRRLRLRIWMLMVLVAVAAIVAEAIHLRSLARSYRRRAVSYAKAEQAARTSERSLAARVDVWVKSVQLSERMVRSDEAMIRDMEGDMIPGLQESIRDVEKRLREKAEYYNKRPWLKRLAETNLRSFRESLEVTRRQLQDFKRLQQNGAKLLASGRKSLDAARAAHEQIQRRVGDLATLRAKYERAASRPWLPLAPDPPEPPLPK